MTSTKLTCSVVAFVCLALASGHAVAERLGGAYRGPDDQKAAESESPSEADEDTPVEDTGPSAGGDNDGDSGVQEEGAPEEEKETGSPEGEGEEPGGDGLTPGGDTGADAGSTPDAPEGDDSGLNTGGSPGNRGRGASAAQQQAFQRVLWYFEHNREAFLFAAAEERNRVVAAPRYSCLDTFGALPRDTRVRTIVTAEDRERIFDLLRKHATIADKSVVRDAAVLALGKFGTDQAVDVLLERLRAEPERDVKEDILLALGLSRNDAALPALIAEATRKNTAHLTPYALLALGLTENAEKAGPVLHEYFRTRRRRSKDFADPLSCAALALGALRYEPAVDDLVAAIGSKGTDRTVKVYCAHALGNIGGRDAFKALSAKLRKGGQDVERAAALALGNFHDAAALKLLAGKGIRRPDPLTAGFSEISMASILRELPDREWKKYPEEIRDHALADKMNRIRAQYANVALAIFDGFDDDTRRYYAEQLLDRSMHEDTKSALAMASGIGGLRSMEPALAKLAESAAESPKTRGYAAMALGMLGKSADTAAKLRRIYERNTDPDVRRGAVTGVGFVGDRDDVPFLVGVLREKGNDSRTRYTKGAAVVALGIIGDSDSIPQLRKLLANRRPRTRAFALAALGYLADKDRSPRMPRLFRNNNFRLEFPTLRIVMQHL